MAHEMHTRRRRSQVQLHVSIPRPACCTHSTLLEINTVTLTPTSIILLLAVHMFCMDCAPSVAMACRLLLCTLCSSLLHWPRLHMLLQLGGDSITPLKLCQAALQLSDRSAVSNALSLELCCCRLCSRLS